MPVNIWNSVGGLWSRLVVAAMQAAFPNISSSTPPPSRFLLFKIGRRMLCDTCVCSTCLPPAHLLLLFLLPRPHHFHSVHRFTQLVFHTYFSIYWYWIISTVREPPPIKTVEFSEKFKTAIFGKSYCDFLGTRWLWASNILSASALASAVEPAWLRHKIEKRLRAVWGGRGCLGIFPT